MASKKALGIGIGLVVIAAAATGNFALMAGEQQQTKFDIKIGVGRGWFTNTPWIVADREGLYAKNGLNAKFVFFVNSNVMLAALHNGEIDVSSATGGLETAWVKGARNFKLVGILSNKSSFMLIGKPGITKLEDLKGKLVATSGAASPDDFQTKSILRANGINPAEVKFQGVAVPERLGALKAGTVDAAVLTAPDNIRATEEGLPVIMNYQPVVEDWAFGGIAVRADTLSKNPEMVKRVIKSLVEAVDIVRTDKVKTVKAWTTKNENYPIAYPEAISNKMWDVFSSNFSYEPTVKGFENVIEFQRVNEKWTNPPKPEDIVDLKILRQVLSEMGKK